VQDARIRDRELRANESRDARGEAVSRVLALGAALYAVLTKLVH